MMASMNAVLIDPPAWFMDRRREMGGDRWDEVWEGVLHMAPQPTSDHQGIGSDLLPVLAALVMPRGWRVRYETSLYDPVQGENNYRVPDLVVVDPARLSKRGVEGRAELVVEILSPNDESRAKLPFYARHGVQEVWLIEPTARAIEIYTLRGASYFAVAPERDGSVRSPVFALVLATVAGPRLRINWDDGSAQL